MEVFMLVMMAMVCYLVGRVAFNEGRKSKWQEVSREYIVLHKSVLIQPLQPYDKKLSKKHLTKHKKNCYNKSTKQK
jgi:hypothetical protein